MKLEFFIINKNLISSIIIFEEISRIRMTLNPTSDPLGQAIYNYSYYNDNTPVLVSSNVVDDEHLPPDYFFRGYNDMPLLEKVALKKCKGKVLDVGAGAGCHSLYLQNKGFDVTAIEISSLCCEVMKKRGIKKVINSNIHSYDSEKFDSIILLMNGIGISGSLDQLSSLLKHLKSLLNPDGIILLDSSDLIYLYQEDDGSVVFDLNSKKYYGEIDYQIKYKEIIGEPFSWIFTDSVILEDIASINGFKTEIIEYGPHYDFLARLTIQ